MVWISTVALDAPDMPHLPRTPWIVEKWRRTDRRDYKWDMYLRLCQPIETRY